MLSIHELFTNAVLRYLDPGSGSFILQLILAAILGAGVAIRIYWSKIKALFTGRPSAVPDSDEDQDEP